MAAFAPALRESRAAGGADPELLANQRTAIDMLALHGSDYPQLADEWIAVLELCQGDPELAESARRARAMLGDARVVPELTERWIELLQRLLTMSRVARVSHTEDVPGVRLALDRLSADLARTADGLRVLAQSEEHPVCERLAAMWWASWQWLGQDAGDRYGAELFALARPGDARLEFRQEDVRRPRDVLRRVTERATPEGRAAAGLIVVQLGPQYRSLARTVATQLAALLPDCSGLEQQRLTWAIGRLSGRAFSPTERGHPLEVTREEVAAAQRWAEPSRPPVLRDTYPQPPILVWRATPAARLLERDLLEAMHRDWGAAGLALNDWIDEGLDCTPRLREVLNPAQRQPNLMAVATALVIVAETDAIEVRPQLTLWREAPEQPAWLRGLAYMVLGSLEARRGRYDSGWPAGLDLGDPAVLDRGRPGWEYFGRVLAAGGRPAAERLATFRPAPLTPAVRTKLLGAARRGADRPLALPAR